MHCVANEVRTLISVDMVLVYLFYGNIAPLFSIFVNIHASFPCGKTNLKTDMVAYADVWGTTASSRWVVQLPLLLDGSPDVRIAVVVVVTVCRPRIAQRQSAACGGQR